VAICRSSARECRQGYATTLLSSVKRQVSAASRIILSYRHRGRGSVRSVGRTPWVGSRAAAMTAECCQDITCDYGLGIDPIFIGSGARTSVAPGSLPTTPSSQWGVRMQDPLTAHQDPSLVEEVTLGAYSGRDRLSATQAPPPTILLEIPMQQPIVSSRRAFV
jgi:hypothetical protein